MRWHFRARESVVECVCVSPFHAIEKLNLRSFRNIKRSRNISPVWGLPYSSKECQDKAKLTRRGHHCWCKQGPAGAAPNVRHSRRQVET